jgi:hypothetical protein
MLTVKSIAGKTIRLTDERWLHIVEGHPEMADHLDDVLIAVAAPDKILEGSYDELLAVVYEHLASLLVVVYKENKTDGFIITAFFTSKVDKLFKRIVLWQK